MKTYSIIIIALFLLTHTAQAQYGFSKIYDDFPKDSRLPRIAGMNGVKVQEYKGFYYVLSYNSENIEGYNGGVFPYGVSDTTRLVINKMDVYGNLIFSKNIPIKKSCWPIPRNWIIENDEIVIVGERVADTCYCGAYDLDNPPPNAPAFWESFVLKTDLNANVLWLKSYASIRPNDQSAIAIQKKNNGNYLVLFGNSENNSTYIIELKNNGDSLRSINLSYNKPAFRSYKLLKSNFGFISIAQIGSNVLKFIYHDLNGDTLYSKYKTTYNSDIIQTKDEGFAILYNAGSLTSRLEKIDKNMTSLWTKYYNSYSYETLKETREGNFIFAIKDFTMVDKNGNLLWTKKIFGGNYITPWYFIHDVMQTSDGGFIITGEHSLRTFLVKTDCNGNVEWDTQSCLLPTQQDVLIFPNPFNDLITIQLPAVNKESDVVTIKITNILGQAIFANDYSNQNIVSLNTNQFATGVYIYTVLINNSIFKSGKIIKQ